MSTPIGPTKPNTNSGCLVDSIAKFALSLENAATGFRRAY